jgi:hypothetical protein
MADGRARWPDGGVRISPAALVVVVVTLGAAVSFLIIADPMLPLRAPAESATATPSVERPPSLVGGYALLDRMVDATAARQLDPAALAAERGAVRITPELLAVGRDAFYLETFGNEVVFTDVLGILDGPLTPWAVAKAVLALRGRPTSNLRIEIDRDVTIGGRMIPAGTMLDTGLDVPPWSALPLGMRMRFARGYLQVGVTCALCHASVDASGRILEGAPNADLDSGLLMALGTNSAALFRQTGADPRAAPPGGTRYAGSAGEERLPLAAAVEDAVDADLLAWPPGNFDSTGDLENNPSQIPSSFTFGASPYGWSGFAAIGWFDGLTTLNNNVHATNSDPTTGTEGSPALLGMDRELYLGVILQHAASDRWRLPDGARPTEFFAGIDPTPQAAGINRLIEVPPFPKGSPVVLDGLLAQQPGRPVAEALNGMSAWQNTLAPPPSPDADRALLSRGATTFARAGCADCHAGRRFTNNGIVPARAVGTQASRAAALAAFPRTFDRAQIYPASVVAPPRPGDAPLPVPSGGRSPRWLDFAYAIDGRGGYKVPSLIGLAVTAPYLHDGGVAAGRGAFGPTGDIQDRGLVGIPGTLGRALVPDPEASLHALLDRRLRAAVVDANRADRELVRANVDGSGHEFWVDPEAGVARADQGALVAYLLSLDDTPALPPSDVPALTRASR